MVAARFQASAWITGGKALPTQADPAQEVAPNARSGRYLHAIPGAQNNDRVRLQWAAHTLAPSVSVWSKPLTLQKGFNQSPRDFERGSRLALHGRTVGRTM